MCPDGFLPAYSVDTEEEAKQLLAFVPLGADGQHYADELFGLTGQPLEGSARIDAFCRFGKKLEKLHKGPFS